MGAALPTRSELNRNSELGAPLLAPPHVHTNSTSTHSWHYQIPFYGKEIPNHASHHSNLTQLCSFPGLHLHQLIYLYPGVTEPHFKPHGKCGRLPPASCYINASENVWPHFTQPFCSFCRFFLPSTPHLYVRGGRVVEGREKPPFSLTLVPSSSSVLLGVKLHLAVIFGLGARLHLGAEHPSRGWNLSTKLEVLHLRTNFPQTSLFCFTQKPLAFLRTNTKGHEKRSSSRLNVYARPSCPWSLSTLNTQTSPASFLASDRPLKDQAKC